MRISINAAYLRIGLQSVDNACERAMFVFEQVMFESDTKKVYEIEITWRREQQHK
jgi:hypothetical protein